MAKFELERINVLWFLTLGVTVLAAGVLIYLLLLESALGAFSIHEASPRAIGKQETPRVALLSSDYTRQVHSIFYPDDPDSDWLDVAVGSWREFLLDKNRRTPFSEVTDEQIEQGDLESFETLILPSARAMSDRQIEAIKEFMERGGNVLATWTPGIYAPDGSWRGWRFIEEAFGVSFVDFVERGTGDFRVHQDTFPGFTPPGMYRPEYLVEDPTTPGEVDEEVATHERMKLLARDADFPPLRGYRWSAFIDDAPLYGDYATADTLTISLPDPDGEMRRQQAVAVSYYTWLGKGAESETPYPYTGTGIRRLTLRGGTPLTANIPSGYRVKIQVYTPGVSMRVIEPRAVSIGFWHDFAVEEHSTNDAVAPSTGAVYGTYGKGRFVYLGFQRDAMGVGREDREDYVSLRTFFSNIMDYLQQRPIIWVHAWPYPYTSGAVLSAVGSAQIENLSGVADVFEQEGVPGTYLVRPGEAGRFGALFERLHDSGDVGVLGDLGRDEDGSTLVQRAQLVQLKEELEEVVRGPVIGYRSTRRGQIGETTLAALSDAGYEYFLPDSIGRLMTPRIMGFPYETLIRLGVTAHSDDDVFRWTGDDEDLRITVFKADIDRVRYEGGIYNLAFHSDALGRPENREMLREVVQYLKQRNFWIEAGDEIAHWWRLRQGLSVDIEHRGPHRIVMRVSNNNGATAEQTGVTIALGRQVNDVRIHPELIGTITPKPILQADNTELVLLIEQLKPQQNRIFHIDLLDEETDQMFTTRGSAQFAD